MGWGMRVWACHRSLSAVAEAEARQTSAGLQPLLPHQPYQGTTRTASEQDSSAVLTKTTSKLFRSFPGGPKSPTSWLQVVISSPPPAFCCSVFIGSAEGQSRVLCCGPIALKDVVHDVPISHFSFSHIFLSLCLSFCLSFSLPIPSLFSFSPSAGRLC